MGITGIKSLLPFIINIQVLITKLVGEIEITQRIPFDGIIQTGKRSLPSHTSGKSQSGMIACTVIESGIYQYADNLFRIETHTQVYGTDRFLLCRQHQVLLLLTCQHIVYIGIGIRADQYGHGMMKFMQGNPAVLSQATDLHQPLLIPGVGAVKRDGTDIKAVGRQYGV